MFSSPPYISGNYDDSSFPLQRFLPRINKGVVSEWIKYLRLDDGWVLDPFCASPHMLIEIASMGVNVVTTVNNPILEKYLYVLANPPDYEILSYLIEKLSTAIDGKKRLEDLIKNAYLTKCSNCGKEVSVDEFIWDRDKNIPLFKSYVCPYCEKSVEEPVNDVDIKLARSFSTSKLHWMRAVSKIADQSNPERSYVENIINIHLPRTIFAIIMTLNHLDILDLPPNHRNYLEALLFSTFDQVNSLWPVHVTRDKPKQLTIPPQFREKNFWNVLENQVKLWANNPLKPIPIYLSPDRPSNENGIYVFRGRFRDIYENFNDFDIRAIISVVPRYNQAFWALSAVWTAWLMGKEQLGSFINVFHRRKYDWGWHTDALFSVFNNVAKVIPKNSPVLLFPSDQEIELISSTVISSSLAGLKINNIAIRNKNQIPQIFAISKESFDNFQNINHDDEYGLTDYLSQLGQPADFSHSYLVSLLSLSRNIKPAHHNTIKPGDIYLEFQKNILKHLDDDAKFMIYNADIKSISLKFWGLKDYAYSKKPLDDRVEEEILQIINSSIAVDYMVIDQMICEKFSGLFTPPADLINVCLNSYCYLEDKFILKPQEFSENREKDVSEITNLLLDLGNKLGYKVFAKDFSTNIIAWESVNPSNNYEFYISITAILSNYLGLPSGKNVTRYIVIPGSRSNLIAYKLRENKMFGELIPKLYKFTKFRNVRRLSKDASISRNTLKPQLEIDPITYNEEQLRLM